MFRDCNSWKIICVGVRYLVRVLVRVCEIRFLDKIMKGYLCVIILDGEIF